MIMDNKTIKYFIPKANCFMSVEEIKNEFNEDANDYLLGCIPSPKGKGWYVFYREVEKDISQLDAIILASSLTPTKKGKEKKELRIRIPSKIILDNLFKNNNVVESIGGVPNDLLWTNTKSVNCGIAYNAKDGSIVEKPRSEKHSVLYASYVPNNMMTKWL